MPDSTRLPLEPLGSRRVPLVGEFSADEGRGFALFAAAIDCACVVAAAMALASTFFFMTVRSKSSAPMHASWSWSGAIDRFMVEAYRSIVCVRHSSH
jgi:hypothetical protein